MRDTAGWHQPGVVWVPLGNRTPFQLLEQAELRSMGMFKLAVIFLIISLIAGGLGLTNISVAAKRISMVLFALFFLMFLLLIGFAYLVVGAIDKSSMLPLPLIG
jgi:uncharacterized membrane protein YtjA (UPF0391 family)